MGGTVILPQAVRALHEMRHLLRNRTFRLLDGLTYWGWCLSCLAFALPLLASGGLAADPALLAPGESLLATPPAMSC